MTKTNEEKAGWKQKLFFEMTAYWINVVYLTILFSVFNSYRRLILAHYDIDYGEYGISLIKALVLAKIVLVVEQFHIGQEYFKDKPLIIPTVIKTFIFTFITALFNVVESLVRSFIHGASSMEALMELMNHLNYEWLAQAVVVFFFFIPFCAVRELGIVMGEGTLSKIFFTKRPAAGSCCDKAQGSSETQ